MSSISSQPFDGAAAGYDESFSHSALGRTLRRRVWRLLESRIEPGQSALELGCGTGEDALWLLRRGVEVLGVDASASMLEEARRKIGAAGLARAARLVQIDLNRPEARTELAEAARGRRFELVLSSFGALNCIADRAALGEAIATLMAPGGTAVLVVMGPCSVSETVLHLLRGRVATAFRRWRPGRAAELPGGATIDVWYPSPSRLRRDLDPWFRLERLRGLGLLLPSTDLAAAADRHPRLLEATASIDELLCRLPWSSWLSDHYLATFRSREGSV